MRISDWSSDVCSSDLQPALVWAGAVAAVGAGDAGPARVAGWLRPVGAFAGDGPGLPGRRRRGAAGDAVADPLVARVGTPAGRELLRRPEHRRGTQARAGFARRDRPLRTRVGRRMQGTTVALARRAKIGRAHV